MNRLLRSRPRRRSFANTVDAFNPQFWANESLAILEENMVIGQMVSRDFQNVIQNYGDVVNTRRIGELEAKRKTNIDNVTVQDVTATNIQVRLDQHVHVSFLIRDGEESISVQSLIDTYMAPAMIAQARFADQVLLGQVYRFLGNSYGRLGALTNTDVIDALTGIRNVMNINKAPLLGRNMILSPNTETLFLRDASFTDASMSADAGTAMREASIGRKFGFDNYMAQNVPSITGNTDQVVGAVNNGAGYDVGTTTMTVDGLAAAITAGTWFTVDGDNLPQQVVSTVGGATPTSITFTPGLQNEVTNDAPVRLIDPGAVNNVSGYDAGYAKEITVDAFVKAPQIGQMVTFGTDTERYAIIGVTGTTGITLDRPLVNAIVNDATVNLGPPGEYNLAFLRGAMTMVVRPLALPRPGLGAQAAQVNINGLSMRATLTYDGNKQGTLVTLDMLFGVQVLDTDLGAVLLA